MVLTEKLDDEPNAMEQIAKPWLQNALLMRWSFNRWPTTAAADDSVAFVRKSSIGCKPHKERKTRMLGCT